MGKRRRIVVTALVVVLLVIVAWRAFGPRGPYYDGKPLSFWLNDHGWGNFSTEAEKAIKQAGTNAIPGLLRMMRARDSSLGLRAKLWVNGLLIHLKSSDIHFYPAAAENYTGASGFMVLGAAASNAVPQLIQIYEANIASGDTVPAARALSAIGPAATGAVPVLVRGMQSQTGPGRSTAIQALGQIHGEPGIAVPALIKCLNDPDALVRTQAAESLGDYGTNALAAVAALKGLAKSPSTPYGFVSGTFVSGTNILAAVPVLNGLAKSPPVPRVVVVRQVAPNQNQPTQDREAAMAALEKIDPKAAAELVENEN